jgi:hypothetical protein
VTAEILRGLMLSHLEGARDVRWHDRYRSIPGIVESARRKYSADAEGRRAIARVTHRLAERCRSADEIKAAVIAEAERCQILPDAALALAGAILAQRMEAAHA